jgi:stage IV sporulation protein B
MVLFILLFSLIIYTKGGIIIKKLLSLIILTCFLCLFNLNVSASETMNTVILGGDSIGLQMNSRVHVVGFYEIETEDGKVSPWKDRDINEGDIIVSIDDSSVQSNADITTLIANKDHITMKLQRSNEYVYTVLEVAQSVQGKNSIGIYVKDKILGVGTLTYIDPNTKTYGALGHSVSNGNNRGNLLQSSIKSIRKASPGVPGEKQATLSSSMIGTISMNTDIGIFGKIDDISGGQSIKIQKAANVKPGKAKILTVIDGNTKEYFEIEIIEVKKQSSGSTKGLKVRVTDPRLLQITGGIIQGMSGSPIIQDGYLVGALSHVVVSSPTIGYGVFAEWMYEKGR